VIELKRDIVATTIPYGQKTTLPKGSPVEITQELGGSYTVLTDYGLLRIEGKDADALGRESTAKAVATADAPTDAKAVATQVWDQMKTCYDPEIPVNIVDLGLVYDMRISPEEGDKQVDVKMTLTAQGCGMGTSIAADARSKLLALPGIADANVEIVWDPPWNPQMISPEGRERLGMA